jgi:hypothetical protein
VTPQAYQTARIGDLERADGWGPIRAALDVRAFGINSWTAHEAGGTLIPAHDESPSGHEELFLVTAGHARFTVGEDELDAPAGEIVFVRDPAVSPSTPATTPTSSRSGPIPGSASSRRAGSGPFSPAPA